MVVDPFMLPSRQDDSDLNICQEDRAHQVCVYPGTGPKSVTG